MPSGSPATIGLPDWRDGTRYAPLITLTPAALAWEWLRRNPGYRAAARGARQGPAPRRALRMLRSDAGAEPWGLHAFEDPDLPAPEARPVWLARLEAGVIPTVAVAAGAGGDCLDVEALGQFVTIVRDARAERVLLSDGSSRIRLDVDGGSLLSNACAPLFRLAGFAQLERQAESLRRLAIFRRIGRFPRRPSWSRGRRLVLLLRVFDALAAGATQREIAAELLDQQSREPRWRTETPSARSRAQRLVRGARETAAGGYLRLLKM